MGAAGRCHGNQFWDAVCYNWLWHLMGYNFGCMIASDTLLILGEGFCGQAIRQRHTRDGMSKGRCHGNQFWD